MYTACKRKGNFVVVVEFCNQKGWRGLAHYICLNYHDYNVSLYRIWNFMSQRSCLIHYLAVDTVQR